MVHGVMMRHLGPLAAYGHHLSLNTKHEAYHAVVPSTLLYGACRDMESEGIQCEENEGLAQLMCPIHGVKIRAVDHIERTGMADIFNDGDPQETCTLPLVAWSHAWPTWMTTECPNSFSLRAHVTTSQAWH